MGAGSGRDTSPPSPLAARSRRVALKLLLFDGAEAHQARLLREARAIARLAHPNVVTVFDVGTFEGRVYVTMEYIDGQTLRQWLAARGRRWQDVLGVYLDAARGLAAAHAAGLVHRDFKPDNAMIDDQDRVRVMDFGLARVVDDAEEGAGVSVAVSAGSESILLTELGVRLGAPSDVAPEQHLGCLTDARTDQFALCVALYEALYGVRPFVGDDRQSLAEQVVAGRLPDPPRGRVPAWLRRAVLRGLANDMDRRWPSMQALVTELERGQVRARFVIVAVVVVVVATLAIGAWTVRRREDTRRLDACAPFSYVIY